MNSNKEKKSILSNGAVQTLLASLFCIVLGLIVGYVVLLAKLHWNISEAHLPRRHRF